MEQVQLTKHISKRKKAIQYIVIHDTANTNKGAGAEAHKKYFLTTNRKASADFVVENDKVIQLNDYEKYFTWHCGDGKGEYGITNSNSIGIEMCVNSDSYRQKTINQTIKLTYKLMKELNLPISRVVRHYDASRKMCPNSMSKDNWAEWYRFLAGLINYKNEQEAPNIIILKYKNKNKVLNAIKKDDFNYVRIRDIADFFGLEISWSGLEITLS